MKRKITGNYIVTSVGGERVSAFVPHPLPPKPALVLTASDQELLDIANRSLGRLDAFASLLPDMGIFLQFYVKKEAIMSSQIEGSQTTLSDLLIYENDAPIKPSTVATIDDIREVSNYVKAIQYGRDRLAGGFPLSLRLIRELHGILLSSGRGSHKKPGEFRTSQNWIGGTRPGNASFVPPPPNELPTALGAFEKFIHDDPVRTPTLIKAALTHVQFETLHPFLDGNGRVGRLLITLMLCAEDALRYPALYVSLYFKEHRSAYYELLDAVRTKGEWERWLRFFLEGVLAASEQATETATALLALFAKDRRKLEVLERFAPTALRAHDLMKKQMIATVPEAAKKLKLSMPTAIAAFDKLQELKIVEEITGKKRDRMFRYRNYYRLLEKGAQPIK